jgi:hypothetical protein
MSDTRTDVAFLAGADLDRRIDERIARALERLAITTDGTSVRHAAIYKVVAAELRQPTPCEHVYATDHPGTQACSRCGEVRLVRKPAPASDTWPEQVSKEVPAPQPCHACADYPATCPTHGEPYYRRATPQPPTLVERLRSYATSPLMNEAADALDAADRRVAYLEVKLSNTFTNLSADAARVTDVATKCMDELNAVKAEHEALRERYARLDAAAAKFSRYDEEVVDTMRRKWNRLADLLLELNRVRKEIADADQ